MNFLNFILGNIRGLKINYLKTKKLIKYHRKTKTIPENPKSIDFSKAMWAFANSGIWSASVARVKAYNTALHVLSFFRVSIT